MVQWLQREIHFSLYFFFTCNLAVTFLRLRCDFPATFSRLSCDFPATFLRLTCDLLLSCNLAAT